MESPFQTWLPAHLHKRGLSRRAVLAGAGTAIAGLSGSLAHANPLIANGFGLGHVDLSSNVMNAQANGLVPNSPDDQSDVFRTLLTVASERDAPVFLPAGVYKVGSVSLPIRTKLIGVPGATRLTFTGRGFMLRAERADTLHMRGIVLDGLGLPLDERGPGLLTAETVLDLQIVDCSFVGSGLNGLDLTGSAGVVRNCSFDTMSDTAIFSKQATGLTVTGNSVADCGNGGILIHRFSSGYDGTSVTNNRVQRVRSTYGGTGQWGNGINVFQAHNVMVANNHIADCTLSAIRTNSAHNVQIIGNQCNGSGETAVYAEFAFEGAVIGNNVIEGGTIGISLANFNEGGRLATVRGNLIRNLGNAIPYAFDTDFKFGIGIYAEADTVVSGNVIENAPHAGIHLGWGEYCRNLIASQNIITSVPWGITASVVDGARSVKIKDNILSNIGRQAITGFRWAEPDTSELLGARQTGFRHLTLSGNALT